MENFEYDYPLYRPPSEAYSLIIQATLGCSHNKCTFCGFYKSKKFTVRPIEEIKKDIDTLREKVKFVERVFIADGDALIIPTKILSEILDYINEKFPENERIAIYASPKSLMFKSLEELRAIREKGVKLLYIGLESGDADVLKAVKKSATPEQILEGSLKAKKAGFQISMTIIAGLVGNKDYTNHAVNTGKIISDIAPDYIGLLCLLVRDDSELGEMCKRGEFIEASGIEFLKEIRMIVENINIKNGNKLVFRSNHISNYLNLYGTLPRDKEKLLKEVNKAIEEEMVKSKAERYLKYGRESL